MMALADNSGVLEAADRDKILNSNEMDVDASVSTAIGKVLPEVWKMGWVGCEGEQLPFQSPSGWSAVSSD